MRGKICRMYEESQTKGTLEVFDEDSGDLEFTCKTLELAWLDNATGVSCIPEGFYDVVPRSSKKYGDHLHVTGVDGRSLILIHWGNYAGSMNPKTGKPDIRGCILLGKAFVDIDGDSSKTLQVQRTPLKR